MTDELFTNLLHADERLTDKTVSKLWSIICERSDGIDVEAVRSEYGLLNKPTERMKIVRRLRYATKSKLGSFSWDPKDFQIGYIWGFPTEQKQVMREGGNKHLIVEVLPTYVDKDDFHKNYSETQSVTKYVAKLSKEIVRETISNSVSKEFPSFDAAIKKVFEEDERDSLKFAIRKISENYNRRFTHLRSMYNFDLAYEYFLPIWTEVIIWTKDWLNGVVDAIYKKPRDAVLPVDYKFGKPKEKYYVDGIAKEMTFYQKLIMSYDAIFAHEFNTEKFPWEPLYAPTGEMWYVLGGKKDVINIEFSKKWDKLYYDGLYAYWDAMDAMDYSYQPTYGYQGDRYSTYCGEDKCDRRKICERTTSFKLANSSDEEYIEAMMNKVNE